MPNSTSGGGGSFSDGATRSIAAFSLTDNTSWITAIGADLDFEQIFVQQPMQYGRPGDLVIAISGSGSSRNVLNAVAWANRRGLITFGLTGYDGGRLRQIQGQGLHVPLGEMGMVESVHLTILHWVVEEIHARVNRVGRHAGAG